MSDLEQELVEIELVTTYHAFTDERDEWFNTIEEAEACIAEWRKEGYTNLRIYVEESEPDGDTVNENYLWGEGDFPY